MRIKKDYKYLKHAATTHRLNEMHEKRVSQYDRGFFAGWVVGGLMMSVVFLVIWMTR